MSITKNIKIKFIGFLLGVGLAVLIPFNTAFADTYITDLTGTSWTFNEYVDISTFNFSTNPNYWTSGSDYGSYYSFDVTYSSDFSGVGTDTKLLIGYVYDHSENSRYVTGVADGKYFSAAYALAHKFGSSFSYTNIHRSTFDIFPITFTGGSDVTNSTLISWLYDNATLYSPSLSNPSNLSYDGDTTLSWSSVANADSYRITCVYYTNQYNLKSKVYTSTTNSVEIDQAGNYYVVALDSTGTYEQSSASDTYQVLPVPSVSLIGDTFKITNPIYCNYPVCTYTTNGGSSYNYVDSSKFNTSDNLTFTFNPSQVGAYKFANFLYPSSSSGSVTYSTFTNLINYNIANLQLSTPSIETNNQTMLDGEVIQKFKIIYDETSSNLATACNVYCNGVLVSTIPLSSFEQQQMLIKENYYVYSYSPSKTGVYQVQMYNSSSNYSSNLSNSLSYDITITTNPSNPDTPESVEEPTTENVIDWIAYFIEKIDYYIQILVNNIVNLLSNTISSLSTIISYVQSFVGWFGQILDFMPIELKSVFISVITIMGSLAILKAFRK